MFLLFIFDLIYASPLGTVPLIEENNLKFIFENSSDLWTSPYQEKPSPLRVYRTSMRIPVLSGSTWKGSINVENESLSIGRSDILLGKNQVYLGSEFRSQSVGFGISQKWNEGSFLTVFGSYMSASDEPFKRGRDQWFEAHAIYRTPFQDDYHWILLLNQSRNRGFYNNHLFPYVGLSYEPTHHLQIIFGFPFFHIMWQNQDSWVKMITVTPVSLRAEMARSLDDRFIVNIASAFSLRSYLHYRRINDNERIYFEEKFIESGFKTNLTSTTSLRFSLGLSFDRKIYEAKDLYAPNSSPEKLDQDLYGRLNAEFRL